MAEIGETLREARMRARIDIIEVESRTKIRAKYLRAIENEEWDLLPGPVYVKSFLKTYGDFLGLDSRLLIDEFKRRYERPLDHDRPLASRGRERSPRQPGDVGRGTGRAGGPAPRPRRRFAIGQWLAVAIVIVGILAALYAVGKNDKAHNDTTAAGITPAHSTHTGSKHHPAKPAAGHKQRRQAKPTAPKLASLVLKPTDSVWMCVENPAGKVLVPGTVYNAGSTIPKVSGKELLVSLGNSNVNATVDGKSYPIATSGSAIALKITPKGASPLNGPGPTCGA